MRCEVSLQNVHTTPLFLMDNRSGGPLIVRGIDVIRDRCYQRDLSGEFLLLAVSIPQDQGPSKGRDDCLVR
jgi:hypothetical protein